MNNAIVLGLLGQGIKGTAINEMDLVDLTESEVVEVVEGLGAYKSHPKYKESIVRVMQATARKNKRRSVQIRQSDSKNMTGKALFEKRISQIDEVDIIKGLANGTLTIADFEAYSIRYGNLSDTIEMFQSSDDKISGVTNIDSAKLANREAMLVTSVIVLSGTGAAADQAAGKATDFTALSATERNGYYIFKNGQKMFTPEGSLHAFNKADGADYRLGESKLEVPKLIQPATEIDFELKLPVAAAINVFFKVVLKGILVVRA